jgi:hypothetical protein
VLTDGSGQLGVPRLAATTRVVEGAGARRGPIYGRFSDGDVYRALLSGDAGTFVGVAAELAGWLARHAVAYVVTDSAEGYNPTHDLCRALVGAAVETARGPAGRAPALYEYVVAGDQRSCAGNGCSAALRWRLDDPALARKRRAAGRYAELAAEVRRAVERSGVEDYRVECLHPVQPRAARAWAPGEAPEYERHGEARVASAKYARVIRHREHVGPLVAALWARADADSAPVAAAGLCRRSGS